MSKYDPWTCPQCGKRVIDAIVCHHNPTYNKQHWRIDKTLKDVKEETEEKKTTDKGIRKVMEDAAKEDEPWENVKAMMDYLESIPRNPQPEVYYTPEQIEKLKKGGLLEKEGNHLYFKPAPPENVRAGAMVYSSFDGKQSLKVYNGRDWVEAQRFLKEPALIGCFRHQQREEIIEKVKEELKNLKH